MNEELITNISSKIKKAINRHLVQHVSGFENDPRDRIDILAEEAAKEIVSELFPEDDKQELMIRYAEKISNYLKKNKKPFTI